MNSRHIYFDEANRDIDNDSTNHELCKTPGAFASACSSHLNYGGELAGNHFEGAKKHTNNADE